MFSPETNSRDRAKPSGISIWGGAVTFVKAIFVCSSNFSSAPVRKLARDRPSPSATMLRARLWAVGMMIWFPSAPVALNCSGRTTRTYLLLVSNWRSGVPDARSLKVNESASALCSCTSFPAVPRLKIRLPVSLVFPWMSSFSAGRALWSNVPIPTFPDPLFTYSRPSADQSVLRAPATATVPSVGDCAAAGAHPPAASSATAASSSMFNGVLRAGPPRPPGRALDPGAGPPPGPRLGILERGPRSRRPGPGPPGRRGGPPWPGRRPARGSERGPPPPARRLRPARAPRLPRRRQQTLVGGHLALREHSFLVSGLLSNAARLSE